MGKYFLFLLLLCSAIGLQAQQKRIHIVHADNSTVDEEKYPNATVLLGNVYVEHEGITLQSIKAVHYKNDNLIKAYGNVVLNQGDTISQTSEYVQYNGNTKKALSWGDVVLQDPLMTLKTDTLHFDRIKQLLFYRSGATIQDTANTLESKKGNYYLKTSKFEALSDVVLTNPDYVLNSEHLEYFTNNGQAFLYGPSTITGEDNFIYTEKGFYDTKYDISHFTKNSKIIYKNRSITADSLYYDRNKAFASATDNIQMLDTVNDTAVRGNYGEFYQDLDSAFVIKRAVAVTAVEKDSMYVHGDTLLVTGKPEKRIVRAYNRVKFFKSDLSGKCDSIHADQQTGLTQMFRNPVIWNEGSQITGDTIQLLSNTETEKMDSLKVLQNAFVIQKDSAGFNQIKGRNILGKFIDNDLRDVMVIGNAESIFYARNELDSLVGIDKSRSSSIGFKIENQKIKEVRYYNSPEGVLYPPSQLPMEERKFRGFWWREAERPRRIEDIFVKDGPGKNPDEEKPKIEENIIEIMENE